MSENTHIEPITSQINNTMGSQYLNAAFILSLLSCKIAIITGTTVVTDTIISSIQPPVLINALQKFLYLR